MVVEHLGGKTPLVVEHERHTPRLPHSPTQKRTFVQMGMDEVGLERGCRLLHGKGKRHIEIELVPRRAHHHTPLPGHIKRPPYLYARHIISGMVSADENRVSALLEMGNLLQDAYVRPVIREEGSGGYC